MDLAARLGFENDVTAMEALRARIAAHQGQDAECRALAERAMRRSLAVGLSWVTDQARVALAELELAWATRRRAGAPRRDRAEVAAAAGHDRERDLVDASVRIGSPTGHRGAGAARGVGAGVPSLRRAGPGRPLPRLLAEDPTEADGTSGGTGRHATTPRLRAARTRLAYGERLRRAAERHDARTTCACPGRLRGPGTRPGPSGPGTELRPSGETARKRDPETLDELTPQELRIVQLVARRDNRDVAAQLFVSHKTVEYHLRKVFLKRLGITRGSSFAPRSYPWGADEGPRRRDPPESTGPGRPYVSPATPTQKEKEQDGDQALPTRPLVH